MQMPIHQPNQSTTTTHYQLAFHITPQSQNLIPLKHFPRKKLFPHLNPKQAIPSILLADKASQ
jgi:hypothetical protein